MKVGTVILTEQWGMFDEVWNRKRTAMLVQAHST